MKTIRQCHHFR